MHIDSMIVGRELKSLRNCKNKTLKCVSRDIGIHFNTLAKYEKDAGSIQLGLLSKLLKYYSVDELIFFKHIREYNHII